MEYLASWFLYCGAKFTQHLIFIPKIKVWREMQSNIKKKKSLIHLINNEIQNLKLGYKYT